MSNARFAESRFAALVILVAAAFTALEGMRASAAPATPAPNIFDRTPHPLVVGDALPDAAYVDQDDKAIHLRDFRGRTVVISFIYTSCTDQCPLVTARFASLAEQLPAPRFELLEISIDPERDTPAVIAAYARAHGVRSKNWRVLTGPTASFDSLAAPLGVSVVKGSNGELLHAERTVVVDPDGRIASVIDAAAWTPGQVVAVARHADGLPSSAFTRLDIDLAKEVQAICGGVAPGRSGVRDVLAVAAVFAMLALLAGLAAWRIFGRPA